MTKIRKDFCAHSLAAVLSVALLASAACSGSSEPGTSNSTDAGTENGGSSSGSSAQPSAGTTSAGTAATVPASGSGGMVGAAGSGGAGGALGGTGGGGGAGGTAGKAGTAGTGGVPVDPNAGTITCALTAAVGAGDGGAGGAAGGAAEESAGGAAGDAAGGSGAAGAPAVVPGPDTIGGFTLYNWVTDQKFPGCGPFFDDITITVTGTPPVTAVATLDSDVIQALNPNGGAVEGSVLWDYDELVNGNSNCASVTSTCFNIEGREPFSLFGDEVEGNFDGPLTKGNAPALHSGAQHVLRVRAYTGPLGGGNQLGEVAITITVKR